MPGTFLPLHHSRSQNPGGHKHLEPSLLLIHREEFFLCFDNAFFQNISFYISPTPCIYLATPILCPFPHCLNWPGKGKERRWQG